MKLLFDEMTCQDLERSSRLEWLETNGLGGFASGTVSGIHTRRYHGLLTAALQPPVGRMLLVAKFEDTLVVDGYRVELSANRYDGAVHPQGYEYLREFRLDPFPTWVYEIGDVLVEKRVFMVHGQDATVVEYEIKGLCKNCHLEVRPLVAYRDYHATTHSNDALDRRFEWEEEGLVSVQPYAGLPRVFFGADYWSCEPTGYWYNRFEYAEEKARGLDYQEDLFQPFVLHFDLANSPKAVVIVSREAIPAHEATALREQERMRRLALRRHAPVADAFLEDLTEAADQFIVRRGDGHSIIAGYPWFGDWGRDTMISLTGLTLVTGRFEVASGILSEFARALDQGMLPNRFPDAGEAPEYNTVDATLWFFEAARSYLQYTKDDLFVREILYPRLVEAMDWHLRGTRYRIHADTDGLLYAGEPGVQLTWMDAKIGDWVVTPRYGKPVEIQALWYNAIRILQEFALRFEDFKRAEDLEDLAQRVKANFLQQFWDPGRGYLLDNTDDPSIRPNQIFAVSLHYSMLNAAQAAAVVDTVERHLLTPIGLRSVSPVDPAYRGHYTGGVRERDSAYHQGSVWLWLMGPFLTAYARVHPGSPRLQELLNGMRGHLREAGIGQLSEIADGDLPHTPRGCFAQAWSVAELLRAAAENIGNNKVTAPDFMGVLTKENDIHEDHSTDTLEPGTERVRAGGANVSG
ncbi:MAG: glycogen debranching enzyme family protein [Acidobacteria bacterium]|nr:glycogen debranching enzyme family protein [Acidobacteriota bacterium]